MAAMLIAPSAHAWDSASGNPTHPTHSYLTEWAIAAANNAEMDKFAKVIVEGANEELHELPVKGSKYGVDLKTWLTASAAERKLLRDREARTATVAKWALLSAAKAFAVQ